MGSIALFLVLAQSALHSITPARIASLDNLTYCCHATRRSQYPLKLGTHISPGWRKAQSRLTSCPRMLSHMKQLALVGIEDGGQNSGNSSYFRGATCKFSSTQRLQNLLEIALSLTVFEINNKYFNFCQNSTCQLKIWKFNIFSEALYLRCEKNIEITNIFDF